MYDLRNLWAIKPNFDSAHISLLIYIFLAPDYRVSLQSLGWRKKLKDRGSSGR